MSAAKRALLEHALALGDVRVWMDGTAPGVCLPENVVRAYGDMVVLDLAAHLEALVLTEIGVSVVLHFSEVAHACVLPWPAIYKVRYVEGSAFFAESLPGRVAMTLRRSAETSDPDASSSDPPPVDMLAARRAQKE